MSSVIQKILQREEGIQIEEKEKVNHFLQVENEGGKLEDLWIDFLHKIPSKKFDSP
jgi:hypothetical protein